MSQATTDDSVLFALKELQELEAERSAAERATREAEAAAEAERKAQADAR